MGHIYVGRQPVFDRSRGVLGYELVFRAEPGPPYGDGDSTGTSSASVDAVVQHTFAERGLDELVGSRLAFLDAPRRVLSGDVELPVPPERTVLQVPESVAADRALLDGVRRLRAAGHLIAVTGPSLTPEAEPLLELAWGVKLDVLTLPSAERTRRFEACRARSLRLVAVRVETPEQLEECGGLGVDYFQGHLLSRPAAVTARSLTPSRLVCLDLVSKLSAPDVRIGDVESLVRADGALSYRVLRASNAAWLGLSRPVRSVREAVMMLGLRTLRSWVLMMVMAASGDTHEEQLTSAMTRARMCELVADQFPGADADAGFTVGLVSALEDVLGVPLELVVDQLPLDPAISAAILRHEGPLGVMLEAVLAYEAGDPAAPALAGLDAVALRRAYLGAVGWSLQTCSSALSA